MSTFLQVSKIFYVGRQKINKWKLNFQNDEQKGTAQKILMRNPGGNNQFGKPRRKWGNNKRDLQEIRQAGVDSSGEADDSTIDVVLLKIC